MAPRIRGRPAHPPGPTYLSYSPDGSKLVTVGIDNHIRVYHTGSDAEPTTIDDCSDNNNAVSAANDFFVTGSEDGTVRKYSFESNTLDEILTRNTLPIRDVALSPDGNWVAVASDELTVKVVNTKDMMTVLTLREQPRAVKHVTWDKSGSSLAVSCVDGAIYIYSISSENPQLLRKVQGVSKSLETDSEASSRAIWHPDGRAFGVPTATRDFQVVSTEDGELQRVFRDGHTADLTAAAWSPNGALLVTTDLSRKMCVWDTKTLRSLFEPDGIRATILAVAWHPRRNILSYTNQDGELYIHTDFIPEEHANSLQRPLQPAPFIHDPLQETSGNARKLPSNAIGKPVARPRADSVDSLDAILGHDPLSDMGGAGGDDFVVDDDGNGYAEINGNGKRPSDHPANAQVPSKRRTYGSFQPRLHEAFQPGSTPWRGHRKYLCFNFTGVVWTVDQETHNTVTVEFHDTGLHRGFHFTDPFQYDKACLNERGALFACPPRDKEPAQIYYRPFEMWTPQTEWRHTLPPGETVISIALSENYIVASTSANYVRVYTLFGIPFRVYRQKSFPAVTCAAYRDYVLTIGNGPVNGDGRTSLLYTIENVKRDETCQSEDVLPLPADTELRNVFFSDQGDPYIYDTSGTLLVLLHWRHPGQAKWTPLLDTTQLDRLASGKRTETYWPVAVANERFHCIILKGGDKYPYFPRPIMQDFGLRIPVGYIGRPSSDAHDDDDDGNIPTLSESQSLEQTFILHSTLLSLLTSSMPQRPNISQRSVLAKRQLDVDKSLLQLLAVECREGEERGMKALEIVGLMGAGGDAGTKMMDAAVKVARRYGRHVLAEKIGEEAERRVAALDADEE